jgi:hypothetical protein
VLYAAIGVERGLRGRLTDRHLAARAELRIQHPNLALQVAITLGGEGNGPWLRWLRRSSRWRLALGPASGGNTGTHKGAPPERGGARGSRGAALLRGSFDGAVSDGVARFMLIGTR